MEVVVGLPPVGAGEAERRGDGISFRHGLLGEAEDGSDFTDHLNPDSLIKIKDALVEQSVSLLSPSEPFQLERIGYFCADPDSTTENRVILNRSVALRDSWTKTSK